MFNHVGVGGDAFGGSGSELRASRVVASLGAAHGWASSSLTLSLQTANPLVESSNRRQSYGSVTYLIRLQ